MSGCLPKVCSVALILALIVGFLPARTQPAHAVSPDIVISQVYGGGGNAAGLTGACPTVGVVDIVGYGTATNCFEGAATANLANTTAALGNSNGAADTDNNGTDFIIGGQFQLSSFCNTTVISDG